MKNAIDNFWKQFSFVPEMNNPEELATNYEHVIVCGMGGSHLAADIMQSFGQTIFIHNDYGLPRLPASILKNSLFVIDSYSGNTEEVLDTLQQVQNNEYNLAIITTGGKLLEIAANANIPHIKIPDTGIQPRAALGYQLVALANMINAQETLAELQKLAEQSPASDRKNWDNMAKSLVNKTPIIYSSNNNKGLAYYWKITLNETGKIPAFYNTFPEMNHNEFTGFDSGQKFSNPNQYLAVMLNDTADDSRIQKRMKISADVLNNYGVETLNINISGDNSIAKIMMSCHAAQIVALQVSELTESESEQVPMIEELKKQLQS